MGGCVCEMGEFELLLLLLLLEMSAGIATLEKAARLSIVGSYRHHINFSPGGFHLTAYIPRLRYMYAQHCRCSTR